MWLQERLVRARLKARDLHRRFGVESADHVDVRGFAERLRIQVVDLPMQGAFAQLISNRSRRRILLSNRLSDPAMRRVAIAHELGHFILNHPSALVCEMDRAQLPARALHAPTSQSTCDLEYEADCFALELLTPKCTVDAYRNHDPDLALCGQLSISAWVPIDYAAVRIAETSDRPCAAVLSERMDGTAAQPARERIRWVAPSRSFSALFGEALAGRLRDGQRLDSRTLAWRILDRGTPCRPGPVPAVAWLGSEHPDSRTLLESSTPVGARGCTLTMLWAADLESAVRRPTCTDPRIGDNHRLLAVS